MQKTNVGGRTLRNLFKKVVVEEVRVCSHCNFLETKKYETRYIWYWLRENGIEWSLNLNPVMWLIFGIFLLYCKIKDKDWRRVLEE